MIRLAARLAVSGGRESLLRLVLTAIGVALGTTLLLLACAADPAIRAHQRHEAWQSTTSDPDGDGDPLLWQLRDDAVDGREMEVLHVAADGPGAPVPLGLGAVPAPGEVFVSPALGSLIEAFPADRLAARFPNAPSGTIGDAYLAGPDDLVAVVGLAADDLRGPGVLEVHRIRTAPAPLGFSDFLRLILAIGAVGLLMPVLVFVSTSTRLGAARREQRFAALRLAGATPRQTNLVAAVEAGAAAAVGAVLGAGGYVLARPTAARIEIDGHRSFVADVQVPPTLLWVVLVAVPLLAVVAAMASLRRLQISPLGVARRATRPRPTAWRLAPLGLGAAGFVVTLAVAGKRAGPGVLVPVMVTFALMIYGIVAAGPWLTVLTARGIGRVGRRPSSLLASRRLEDDPSTGFRAVSGLVLAVFVASVFSGMTPALLADDRPGTGGPFGNDVLETLLPGGTSEAEVAALGLAATEAGGEWSVVIRSTAGDEPRPPEAVLRCRDVERLGLEGPACPDDGVAMITGNDGVFRRSPLSLDDLAERPPLLVVVGTDGTPRTTDLVRTAIAQTMPGAVPRLGSEVADESNRRLAQLNKLANLALALTLVIAGCGLAVAVAGGIIERRRPFALLRLAGMHLGELQRVAMLEASAPLLLIAGASAILGLGTSAVVLGLAGGIPWRVPAWDYWASLGGGLALALGVAAATLPLLGRATVPSAVRFE